MKESSNAKILWEGGLDGDNRARIIALRCDGGGWIAEISKTRDALGNPSFQKAEGSDYDLVLMCYVATQSAKLFRTPRQPKAAS